MPPPRKDTERFPIRMERTILEKLRQESARRKLPNVQALAVQILTEAVQKGPEQSATRPSRAPAPDIDLRALLIDAHRTIARLTDIIASMEADRKK